jgi:hypothetical protein
MKTKLRIAVALTVTTLVWGCTNGVSTLQRGDASPLPNASTSNASTSNCVGIACCTSQISCDEKGQLPKSTARESRFYFEVRRRAMPQAFRISDNLIGEKVVPEPTKISDYASEGMKKGVSGGAQAGAGIGLTLARIFPPAIILTPALLVGGAAVGAVAGPVIGAGVGAAKHGTNVAHAHISERESTYSSLTELVVSAARIEFDQDLSSLSLKNSGAVDNTPKNLIECTIWIEPLLIRTKEKPAKGAGEEAGTVNHVEMEIFVEATGKTGQRAVWHTRFHETFVISGDPGTATNEAMNRAGKEIAALALRNLNANQPFEDLPRGTVFSSSGTVHFGASDPPMRRSDVSN